MAEDGNLHLQKLVNQFLQSLIANWDEELVFLTESLPTNHWFITDQPFFSKYGLTFSRFSATAAHQHQLVESFLELLPYPDAVNGQPRSVEEPDSWFNEFKTAINERHPKCTPQSLDESLAPILSCCVSKMLLIILSAHHTEGGDAAPADIVSDESKSDSARKKNIQSMCISKVELEATTVSWILSVFQNNLQKAVKKTHFNPLLDAYASRALLYWSKVSGLLSMRAEDEIISIFRTFLNEQKNPQSISAPAMFYFAALRYVRVTPQNQEKYLNFFLPYLQHQHRRTPDSVISSLLLTLCNVFRQCDFTRTDDKTLVLKLAEINELLKRLAEKKKLLKPVKKQVYITNVCFLLRAPDGLFRTLAPFMEKRCIAHLDESDKCEQCLDMLIYLLQGTYDPFLSFFQLKVYDKSKRKNVQFYTKNTQEPAAKDARRKSQWGNSDENAREQHRLDRVDDLLFLSDIDWTSKIRHQESEREIQDRIKHIFKALVRKSVLKLMRTLSTRHWKKLIFVMTKLMAQDLEFGIAVLLPQLVDSRRGGPLTMELALDMISEMLRPNGTFNKYHAMSKVHLDTLTSVLPTILDECESAIGNSRLHKRETPLLLHYDARFIDRYRISADPTNREPNIEDFNAVLRINMEDPMKDKAAQSAESGQVLDEEEKQIYDEEKALLDDIQYKQIRDAQLLSLSFLQNDKLGAKILQLRQKHRGYDDIELGMKNNKGAKKEYLNVLRACIRCILSLRPNGVLTDCGVKNLTYIGRYLLHQDYEVVMATYAVLRNIVRQEKMLLSAILTGLTNYLLQFYIHRAPCISILIQTISGLVSTFIESHSIKDILRDRGIVDDLCFAFNRLDALAFAFFCHTNLYVRYSCINLTLSVAKGLKIIIAHYFADQSPEEQQRQLTFPASLGNLFQLYSADIIKRARRKYFIHRDNMDKTSEPFDKYFNEHYIQTVENISHEGILKMLLVQDDYTPAYACVDAIVEKIESLCLDGSIYFRFLRVDSCQEILLQENWLGVDEQSKQSEILQSMCVALVCLVGFSDNGMDDVGFYDSIWKQLERFSHVDDVQLVHTVLYALQSAHFTRVANVYESLDAWFRESFEKIPARIKKKHRKRMFQDNCVRVWLRIYVVLALTGTERLFEAFLSEIKMIQQDDSVQKRDEQHKKVYYLHAGLVAFCNEINTEFVLKHTNADPEVLRSVARIVENVAITLFKVYQRTGCDWVLRLWSAQDRASLLSILCVWSECTNDNAQGRFIVDSIRAHRTKLKDKEADRKEEKKVLRRIKRIEIQANRAATALLCLGPALDPHVIVPNANDDDDEEYIDDEKEDSRSDYGSVYSRRSQRPKNRDLAKKAKAFTWFVWAIKAQTEGVPALKYLMQNHYSRMLKYVLATLYAEQSRGAFDHARIYFDVITSLELPGEDDDEDFNAMEIIQRLVAFCLMYLVPFVPHQLIRDAQPYSHHRRDQSSIITFRGVPVDNFGANYAVSLPSAMQPAVVHQIQTSKLQSQTGKSCYNRPRLLSPACVQSMGRGTHMDKLLVNRHGKVVVELVDDIMQAIDMSRKTFSLFYKVVLLIGETSGNVPTLDKLHELRMGLQSNDLRDVRQNASAISWVFASVCDTDLAVQITDEILNTLESYAERIEILEERGQLTDTALIHDQITMISNFLQVSLPWFVAAPLHQRKQDTKEACLDKILSLTLRFQHFKKPEIDNAFFRIWHVLVTANDTLLSSPEAENIDYAIRFLVMTVCGRYQGYSEDMAKIERLEQEAMRYESKHGAMNSADANGHGGKRKKKSSVKRFISKKKRDDQGAEYQGPTLEELHEFRKETLKPEQFISLCESIIKQIFATHPECVMSSLLQLISVGCGLGGHVLENADHIQIKRPGQAYVDSSYQLGGSKYSLLVTEIGIRWFMSLATKSFNKIQQCLPVLMVHCILFLTRGFEDMSNVPAEFISHLFVSLLPPKLGIDDEVIQIALWLRDRRTYQFKWSEELINSIEPEKSRMIHKELANAFEDNVDVYRPFDLRRFFAQQNVVYIDDLVRILFNCYRHRYGNREAAVWGIRALQWATVDVDKEEETTVYFARIMASRALRLFCIISEPKTVRSVSMILKSILTGLRASEQFWRRKELEEDGVQKYSQEDMHLSMAIRGIEALVAMVRTEDWNRTLFRMMLVAFWIALALLQCRIARVQIAARRLLRTTLQHRPWLVYLFGQAKTADGTNLKKGSISLEMFWSFYKLFENDFSGIQERVISALIFTIGDDAPVTLNTDTMMILCCVWLIRCDVLHDRNISSRLAANLSFFLPYACALLGENYFQSNNIDQHLSGHRPDTDDDGVHGMSAIPILNDMDDDDDEMKTGNDVDGEAFSGKELRDKYDAIFRLRKENARIFKTLALYIQQNVIKEEKGKPAVRLAEIDINDKNALSQFPMPDWSKVNRNFRQTYVGIYDVVSHIATALMASWTMNEPSTLLALGDFCQYLIDVFIPGNAATLANVFSICLLIGDEYLKIGTIKALQLFVPRLFKQCKTMEISQPVIACFDETFERCTHLTVDENDRVSQCAHQFIFELTSNGYKAFNSESKLMRAMYPSFREVNTNDDGMATTIADLSKILHHTEQLLHQYPDQPTVGAKLDRLLHMQPKDGSMSHNQNHPHAPPQQQQAKHGGPMQHLNPNQKPGAAAPQQPGVVVSTPPDEVLSPPPPGAGQQLGAPRMPDIRRGSQMHQPPDPRSGDDEPALKSQPSYIQNKDAPMQHNALQKDKHKVPARIALQQLASILPEDEENDDGPSSRVESPRFGARPPGAKHRDLLSQVTVLSMNDDPGNVNVNVMNMGSYRDLRIDRTVTIENLEKTVNKQMQNKQHPNSQLAAAANDMRRPSGVAVGGKRNQFGSGPLNNEDGDDQKQQPQQNAMPYGMADTRPKYMQAKAAQQQNGAGGGHHKVPTFGASGRNLRQEMASAPDDDDDDEEDDDEDELESEPQKFPKMPQMDSYAVMIPPANHHLPARPAPAAMRNETQPGMDGEGVDDNENDEHSQSMNSAPSVVINTITVNLSPRKKPAASPINMDNVPVLNPGAQQNVAVGDLSTFLDDTALLRTFLKFLKKKTDDYKLLEFYLMAGQFKTHATDPKSTFSAQRNNAKLIIESFFLPDSKKFLEKIQGMTRHEAMSQFLTAGKSSSFPATLFDRSRQEVKSELISRVFPIFMQSDRYKKLVDEGKIRPP